MIEKFLFRSHIRYVYIVNVSTHINSLSLKLRMVVTKHRQHLIWLFSILVSWKFAFASSKYQLVSYVKVRKLKTHWSTGFDIHNKLIALDIRNIRTIWIWFWNFLTFIVHNCRANYIFEPRRPFVFIFLINQLQTFNILIRNFSYLVTVFFLI